MADPGLKPKLLYFQSLELLDGMKEVKGDCQPLEWKEGTTDEACVTGRLSSLGSWRGAVKDRVPSLLITPGLPGT